MCKKTNKSKKRCHQATEQSLFLAEMSNVKPLSENNKIKRQQQKKSVSQFSHKNTTQFIDDNFSDSSLSGILLPNMPLSDGSLLDDCPDILHFSRSGIQHKVQKKLRQGNFPIEAKLDLHGATVTQARKELQQFIDECITSNIHVALIVHGKGYRSKDKPVIKPMLNYWLPKLSCVLAFHSALPKDGGSGAVYVLFKRQ